MTPKQLNKAQTTGAGQAQTNTKAEIKKAKTSAGVGAAPDSVQEKKPPSYPPSRPSPKKSAPTSVKHAKTAVVETEKDSAKASKMEKSKTAGATIAINQEEQVKFYEPDETEIQPKDDAHVHFKRAPTPAPPKNFNIDDEEDDDEEAQKAVSPKSRGKTPAPGSFTIDLDEDEENEDSPLDDGKRSNASGSSKRSKASGNSSTKLKDTPA